jgi:regulator of nucleoside diphosphate kinase
LIVDAGLYAMLLALAEQARVRTPALANQLIEELERAALRSPDEMPDDVVTIGSTVTFRDGDRTQTVQVVLPGNADIDRRRISVVAPVGTALLGLSAGQRISWAMPDGRTRIIEVVDVHRAS